jgi:hypothetical protein
MAAAATARKAAAPARAPRRKRPALAVAPARKPAPARRAPARKPAPARRTPARRPGGQLIPIAVGTASAVRRLPDSGLIVRLTRGRAWIGLLGVLLAGIVALNVLTLSVAAEAGHVAQNVQALEEDNSVARSRDAQRSGAARIRHEAAALGLSPASLDDVGLVRAGPDDAETAARRLAAAEAAY